MNKAPADDQPVPAADPSAPVDAGQAEENTPPAAAEVKGAPAVSEDASLTPEPEARTEAEPVEAIAAEPVSTGLDPEPASVVAAPARRQMGFFGVAVAALISGLLGGAFAFALVGMFYNADANIDAITELEARAVDLRQRVEVLENRADASVPAGAAAPAELAARLDALEAGLTALGTKLDNLPATTQTSPSGEDAALAGRLQVVEQRFAALPVTSPSTETVTALGSRVDGLEQQLAQATREQRAGEHGAAQLAVVGALNDAIREGKPYGTELAASRALLGSAGEALAPLQANAATGFPDGLTLAVQLAEAADAARAAAATAPQASSPGGVLDRIVDSASKLVTLRRADEPVVDTNSDRARLDTARLALERGDFATAAKAIDAMSSTARAPLTQVAQVIAAREGALATVSTIRQGILASLPGGSR